MCQGKKTEDTCEPAWSKDTTSRVTGIAINRIYDSNTTRMVGQLGEEGCLQENQGIVSRVRLTTRSIPPQSGVTSILAEGNKLLRRVVDAFC